MILINWDKGFTGIDGKKYFRKDIEEFFKNELGVITHIKGKLTTLVNEFSKDVAALPAGGIVKKKQGKKVIGISKEELCSCVVIINVILKKLEEIIMGKPVNNLLFASLTDKFKNWFINQFKTNPQDKHPEEVIDFFYKKIENAFSYEYFRSKGLNRLAARLNIKTCPYCNHTYTLVVEDNTTPFNSIPFADSEAFLQFDHFFPKSKYPILSMSLYNLIPSCPICNLKKRDSSVSMKFHPYVSDINTHMKFRIANTDMILNPMKEESDFLKVEIDTGGDRILSAFYKDIALAERYSRHLDVVRDINTSIYLSRYYDARYSDIAAIFSRHGSICENEKEALERHIRGYYQRPEDIGKRPLTKFSQDIHKQLTILVRAGIL